ncbi:MAG: tRNA (adenosine(37)-N6)-threonylcarbamoyltransferase complex ATPase subunit type 1 TsaE [Kiritimatiellae bacterium]|nr:tRNA (adenosine(37)-N6)-threonylcarbamoyltransferase complex ATPase subunit type 1 TsaE [Kiritimatiellia bacterium]
MKGLFKVSSVEETWEVARKFASGLKGAEIIALEGDLGAGKTTFTQGLAAALGAKSAVSSPTFCIVQEHPEAKLVHLDLYRLSGEDDVIAVGWEDFIDRGDTIVVEWPERAGSLIPDSAIRVCFRHGAGEEEREIEIK